MNSLNPPFVSLVIAALCAVLQIALAALVIQRRAALGIGFLDGGDAALLKRMRTHGNFTETVPLMLLLLLMLELAGLPRGWLWGLGAALLSSRVLHAWGLLGASSLFGRVSGTLLTLFVLAAQALAALVLAWR
jgi:uncharacterized membrane protein YecN with MAPEG domain